MNSPAAHGAPINMASLMPVLLAALTMRFSLRVTAWEIAGTRLIESESVSTAGMLISGVT